MEEVIKADDYIGNIGDYDVPIHNAIIVPKNATNGDMMKEIFPDLTVKGFFEVDGCIDCIAISIGTGTNYFTLDWWDALYDLESENEE